MVSGVKGGPLYVQLQSGPGPASPGFTGIQPVVVAVGAGDPAGKTKTCHAVPVGFVHPKVPPKEVAVAVKTVGLGQAIPVVNALGPAGVLIIPPPQSVLT